MTRHYSPLDFVVGVGSPAQAEAEDDAAAADQRQTYEDVDQRGGPEGEQVERPVAVGIAGYVPVVVGLINGVDPHVT